MGANTTKTVVRSTKGLARKGGKKNRKYGRNRPGKQGTSSDANQKLRTASNKLRAIRKDMQEKAHAVNHKFAKGVCKGHTRQERKLDAQLKHHLQHVAAQYEAHRHNPTAVLPTSNDLHTARMVMLWQRQQEIRAQDEQRAARLEARKQQLNNHA